MTSTGFIRTERHGQVVAVTIDRPAKLNAFTTEMYRSFGTVFRNISEDSSARCVLLRAEGTRAFSVGSDIGQFRRSLGQPKRQRAESRVGREALDAMTSCPQPIVVAVNGLSVGGGLQIAAAGDIRVASGDSRFGIPIRTLGMHAEIEDLATMRRALGESLCLDLLLTGRLLEADEALACGFLHRLVESARLEEAALSLAGDIADGAPLAARWHKRALRALAEDPGSAGELREEALLCYGHSDFAEGCAAFGEKRKPVFVGA